MATVSFKTDDHFKHTLETLAEKKGINTSAYIKLTLVKAVKGDLLEMTENGLTIAEELSILDAHKEEKLSGPFTTTKSLMKALRKK